MRLVVGLFAMFLTASIARADEAKAPEAKLETSRVKVPLRLVKILADSRQVLLFDKTKGTHVLAEVGQTIDGYMVDDIDEDEVTLITASGKEIVLTAPAPEAKAPAKKPTTRVLAPADDAPVDPYAEPAVRSVTAPSALPAILPPLGGGGTLVDPSAKPAKAGAAVGPFLPPGTSAAVPAKPAAKAPVVVAPPGPEDDPYAADNEPAPAPMARPVVVAPPRPALDPDAPPAPVVTPTVLSRSELNVALGDFNKLSSMIRGSFTKDGARLDSVAPNSVFAKAGLRAGDTVTAVDNAPIHSIDDAAELYVRAPHTRAANVQLLRGGKPMTLRVLMQ